MSSVAATAARLYAVFCSRDDPADVWAEPIVSVDDVVGTAFRTARGARFVDYRSHDCGSGPKLVLVAEREDLPPELLPRLSADQVRDLARKAVGGA